MSLIEGVGDEVTNFFIVMSVLLVGWLAWCSTSITDQPLIRTVLILRDRTPTRITALRSNQQASQQNINNSARPPNLETTEEETVETISHESSSAQAQCPHSPIMDSSETPQEINTPVMESSTTEEVLIGAMDSFNNDDPSLLERVVKINGSDATNKSDETTCPNSSCTTEDASISANNEITIKLKFINDDQKLVTGSLKEMLGDFKRKHFQMELEAHKSVRLVFNGRILQPDTQTLEQCGLFNDCVVHCWVHQPRPATVPSSQASTLNNSSSIYFNSQRFSTDLPTGTGISSVHNEWDLSRVLVSILTIFLGLAWYSRYHYAQLFTATTTLALYALTAIFTVSLFSNFFPDQDNIRNVE